MSGQRNNRSHFVFPTLLLALVMAATSCELIPHTTEFIVGVDEIVVNPFGPTDVGLAIQFLGLVGSDQCSRLVHVEKRVTADSLIIRFHGERRHGTSCKQMQETLEHVEMVPVPLNFPFTIVARQPRGAALVQVVPASSAIQQTGNSKYR